ncbi:MAG: glycosyltransferase [Rhodopila sp.]|nr:glycosyltransferase [Rhodopila sp.]
MADDQTNRLRSLINPELDLVFADASRIGFESAWFGHVPFAHWLIGASQPNLLVELGTHNGASYTAFCDAIVANRLPTRAAAIDTWRGDAQAGIYGSAVFDDLKAFHDPRYGTFSTLIQARFDDALPHFSDSSIDLLHIDGEHSYNSARHDFESWRRKLSDNAIVLFHDTQVREPGYGVWQVWQELRQTYPGFEFLHASGLGVLGVGRNVPAPVAALLAESHPEAVARIRGRFASLGARWQREAESVLLKRQLENALRTAHEGQRVATEAEAGLRSALDEVRRLESALASAQQAEPAHFRITLVKMQRALDDTKREHQAILNSTTWRATAPVRKLASLVPFASRKGLRRLVGWGRQLSAQSPFPDAPPRRFLPGSRISPSHPSAAAVAARSVTPRAVQHRIVYISGEPGIPGHIYRVERYVEAFAAAGASVSWIPIDEAEYRLDEIARATLVIIWRAVHTPTVARLVAAAREAGALLVFDVDDLMFRPELAQTQIIDGIRSQNLYEADIAEYYQHVQDTLMQTQVCFTSTDELATHAQRFERVTYVLPNGFDAQSLRTSRLAVRRHRLQRPDDDAGILRIGYAAGSRTHQKDFAQAAGAIARILAERPECRLVLFREPLNDERMFDPGEFPALAAVEGQIEWRDRVALEDLPNEIARFDINIAPLELYNPFVEAKSELKYFEAALVDVPTVASPTGPLRRAIRDRETGRLARSKADWYNALSELLDNAEYRKRLARAAYLDVLWRFGPERRVEAARSVLHQLDGGQEGAWAFELDYRRATMGPPARQSIPEAEVMFESDTLGSAEVTVIIPLYNYAQYITEALESVRRQTCETLDLIVIDDRSTDTSLSVALDWANENAGRFNRLLVMQNRENSGLALTRNLGFDRAETPFILPLDADNRLLEDCVARCLQTLADSGVAFAYPLIRNFGDSDHLIGEKPYVPMRLAAANYIDAMAMVRKSVWAAIGGFVPIRFGWEDYDFWCRCAEFGFLGIQIEEVLAEYRFHDNSMLRTTTDIPTNKIKVIEQLERNHPWLRLPREL